MSSYSNYLGSKKCCSNNLDRVVVGPQGPKGSQGAIGPFGYQGYTGATGPRGATGLCCRGPPGTTGAQGATGPGGALGFWGSFWSTETQTNPGPTPAAQAMTLNKTAPDSNGVSIVANSQITVANAGVYNIQFSAQIQDTTSGGGVGSKLIQIWFEKNGLPIPDSNTNLTTDNQNSFVVASWNFMTSIKAGDYIEIFWYSADTGMQLTAVSPSSPGPDIPSVIVTVQQVMNTQLGPQGATGPSQWTPMNGVGGLAAVGYTGIGVTGQDVLIYGNLLVTGGIDPTYLALTPQLTVPSVLENPLWIDSTNGNALRSKNIYMDNPLINNQYISLKPDNNSSQITLSNGLTDASLQTIDITFSNIKLTNGSSTSTIGVDTNNNLLLESGNLNMNNNTITNVQSVSNPSGNIEIGCDSTDAGGIISLSGGTGLISTTSSGTANKYLVLTINGTPYKIALDNV